MKPRSRRLPLDLSGLGGNMDIFRLTGMVSSDPVVDTWLRDDSALRSMARQWFARMRACGGDVQEMMHDGCPVAGVEDAPFGYVNTFKSHLNVGFFQGASLEDPARLLEGSGKRMRHVKLRIDASVNSIALGDLIDAAYRDIKFRLHP